jgi:hypothetical protein
VVTAANPIEPKTERLSKPEKICERDVQPALLNPFPGFAWPLADRIEDAEEPAPSGESTGA